MSSKHTDFWTIETNFVFQGDYKPENFIYYKRALREERDCFAHIFAITLPDKDELAKAWKSIDTQISFFLQRTIPVMIDKCNFYVCYFIHSDIDSRTVRDIETDDFCSKKYVFSNISADLSDEQKKSIMEKRIFAINKKDAARISKPMISSITTQNFRIFEGKRTFSFMNTERPEETSKLVVIFAANGSGKTTLLDSFEYMVTGSVNRIDESLKNQHSKKKENEPIYHNYNRRDESAFTQLNLSDGSSIVRKVSKFNPETSDRRKNGTLNSGTRAFLNPKQNEKKWNTFLITHELLDSYLNGTTPKDKYKQMVDNIEGLSESNKTMKAAYDKLRQQILVVKKLEKDQKDNKKALDVIKQKRSSLKTIKEYIRSYNRYASSPLEDLPDDPKLSQYNHFMTIVRTHIAGLNEQISVAKTQIKVIDSLETAGISSIFEKFKMLEKLENELSKMEKQLTQRLDAQEKRVDKEKLKKEIAAYKSEIANLEYLIQHWDVIQEKKANYEKSLELISICENSRFPLDMTTDTYANYSADRLRILLTDDMLSSLLDIQKEYDSLVRKKREQEQYKAAGQNILETLFSDVRNYLRQHPDTCKCPVCGHDYASQDRLLSSIQLAESGMDNLTRKEETALKKQKDDLNLRYKQWVDQAKDTLNTQLSVLQNQCISMERGISGNAMLYIRAKGYEQADLELSLEQSRSIYSEKEEKLTALTSETKAFPSKNIDLLKENICDLKSQIQDINNQVSKFLPYKDYSRRELSALPVRHRKLIDNLTAQKKLLQHILNEDAARSYFAESSNLEKQSEKLKNELITEQAKLKSLNDAYITVRDSLVSQVKEMYSQKLANEIFQKINPNQSLKNFEYEISFSDSEIPEALLTIWAHNGINKTTKYKPEYYFSTAQLNTVVFSIFMARALQTNDMPLKTIMIDDPVGHFDDINILNFADLLRAIITNFNCQIVITTYDAKAYTILKRKLDSKYYPTTFLNLNK